MKSDEKDKSKVSGTEGASVVRRAKSVVGQVAELGWQASQAQVSATHAVEDGLRAAKRTVTRGRHAAEDVVDAATLEVRRHPLQAVGAAFAAGALLGCLVGLLAGWSRRDA